MHQVLERGSRSSCRWSTTDGLDAIPPELHAQTVETVRLMNGRLGWDKYMVIPDLTAYQACLRAKEE